MFEYIFFVSLPKKSVLQLDLTQMQFPSQKCPAVKNPMKVMVKKFCVAGRNPLLELDRGDVEEKTELLAFLGTSTLQMFPSQQDEHICRMRPKPSGDLKHSYPSPRDLRIDLPSPDGHHRGRQHSR